MCRSWWVGMNEEWVYTDRLVLSGGLVFLAEWKKIKAWLITLHVASLNEGFLWNNSCCWFNGWFAGSPWWWLDGEGVHVYIISESLGLLAKEQWTLCVPLSTSAQYCLCFVHTVWLKECCWLLCVCVRLTPVVLQCAVVCGSSRYYIRVNTWYTTLLFMLDVSQPLNHPLNPWNLQTGSSYWHHEPVPDFRRSICRVYKTSCCVDSHFLRELILSAAPSYMMFMKIELISQSAPPSPSCAFSSSLCRLLSLGHMISFSLTHQDCSFTSALVYVHFFQSLYHVVYTAFYR